MFPSPTGYMLASFNFFLLEKSRRGIFSIYPLNVLWVIVFLKSWTSKYQLFLRLNWFISKKQCVHWIKLPNTSKENYAKKELPSFSSCGSVDQLLCNRLTTVDFIFWFTNWTFKKFGACNIPLERSWKHLFNDTLHTMKNHKTVVGKHKRKFVFV